jgi:hypothetical protein
MPSGMVRVRLVAVVAAAVACTSPRPLGEGARHEGDDRVVRSAARIADPVDAAPAVPVVASCVDDGDPFAVDTLRDRVAYLASPALGGRAVGTAGDRAAREHVAARFRCLGLAPAGDDGGYEHAFVAGDHHSANIVGLIAGTDPIVGSEIVLVGAHLDHLGDLEGKRYLGANDNASGTAALLALAQHVAARGTPPRRTLAFVGFADEESGMVGSRFFVKHPPAAVPLDRIVYMVNLDMVGSYASRGAVWALGSFAGTPGRAALDALVKGRGLSVRRGGAGSGSDHKPFCDQRIPYVFFWTPDDRCYHEPCDLADRLDYASMSRIARLATDLTLALADGAADLAAFRARRGCGR